MKHRPPKKSSMKQKLAAALSIVNALNVCAPMALPYVNVTRNYSATGGQAAPSGGEADPVDALIFAVQKAMQLSIAYAEDNPTTVTSDTQGNPVSVPGYQSANVTLINGGIMNVNGGTATSTTISKGGTQIVNAGGNATSTTIYDGGTLDVSGGITSNAAIEDGGTMIVTGVTGTGGTAVSTTVNAGAITVKDGGTANQVTLAGGTIEMETGAITVGTLQGYGTATDKGGTLQVGGANHFGSLLVSSGTLATQNDIIVTSSGDSKGSVTINSGGRLQAAGAVTVEDNGAITMSSGGVFSAASISVSLGANFSLYGGILVATDDINVSANPTGATGTISAGGTLSIAGITKGAGALHLAAGKDLETIGGISATTVSAGGNISAAGQRISATDISAGQQISAGVISAGGNVTARVVSASQDVFVSDTIHIADGHLIAGREISAGTVSLSGAPASFPAVSAGNNITVGQFNLSGFDAGATTSGNLISAGSTLSVGSVNGETVDVGGTATVTPTATLKDGIVATQASFKISRTANALNYDDYTRQYTAIELGQLPWEAGETYYTHPDTGIPFSADARVETKNLVFTNPADIDAGKRMTLIAGAADLPAAAAVGHAQAYSADAADGVRLDALLSGSVTRPEAGKIVYEATANQATKLTFTNVAWSERALIDHSKRLNHIVFNGADVDTTNICFTNIQSLDANKKMTLVSNFGDTVGTITGSKYKVGSTLEGTGKASLAGNDLIFTAETGTAQEQTHNTVMGAEVAMTALAAGNDFVGAATNGLSLAANVGADGVSSYAQMGGGTMRQETGSHVDAHTWNAILALGHANKKERGTFEYGAFFEYGTGNYTTHNGDERGDGSMHYTGGGLLAKWTAAHGMYVEGSLRAGSVHDDARNVLRDVYGNPYSYETDAPYFGAHLGLGKEIALAGGNSVDVYGKYFVNRRNGVSFDAGGHYDLDAVTSQVLRMGARYTMKREKWNFYAGVAYEHELDGKATGRADGLAIRSADIKGGSARLELGATMKPDKNSPWSLDLNVAGFAGKKQGVSGGVSVSFMF